MDQQVYTVREAARLMRVSADTVRRLIADGRLAAVPIGRGEKRKHHVITASAIAKCLDAPPEQVRLPPPRRHGVTPPPANLPSRIR